MELPIAVFDRITGNTGPISGGDSIDPERRQYRRLPFGTRAALSPIRNGDEGPPTIVLLRDIALGGIGFLNAEPIKVGEQFVIRFKDVKGRPVRLACVTQRCDQGGTGGAQFVIGASFEQLLEPLPDAPDQEDQPLEAAGAPALPPAPTALPTGRSSLFSRQVAAPSPAAVPVAAITPPPSERLEPGPRAQAIAAMPPVEQTPPSPAAPIAQTITAPAPFVAEPKPAEMIPQPELAAEPVPAPAPVAPLPETAPLPAAPQIMEKPMTDDAPKTEAEVPAVATTAMAELPPQAKPQAEPMPHSGNPHEVVAKVRARLAGQNQALQSQARQLEDARHLAAQASCERDELKKSLAEARNETAAQLSQSTHRIAGLEAALISAQQTIQQMQAKIDDDNKAIAELMALLEPALEAPVEQTTV